MIKTFTIKLVRLISCLLVVSIATACQKDKLSADLSSKIVGNYKILTYKTQAGISNPGELNEVEIKRIDNLHIELNIRYIDVVDNTKENLIFSEMYVQKEGEVYDLSQLFGNAKAGAEINSSNLVLKVNYSNGNFLDLRAQKKQ